MPAPMTTTFLRRCGRYRCGAGMATACTPRHQLDRARQDPTATSGRPGSRFSGNEHLLGEPVRRDRLLVEQNHVAPSQRASHLWQAITWLGCDHRITDTPVTHAGADGGDDSGDPWPNAGRAGRPRGFGRSQVAPRTPQLITSTSNSLTPAGRSGWRSSGRRSARERRSIASLHRCMRTGRRVALARHAGAPQRAAVDSSKSSPRTSGPPASHGRCAPRCSREPPGRRR